MVQHLTGPLRHYNSGKDPRIQVGLSPLGGSTRQNLKLEIDGTIGLGVCAFDSVAHCECIDSPAAVSVASSESIVAR